MEAAHTATLFSIGDDDDDDDDDDMVSPPKSPEKSVHTPKRLYYVVNVSSQAVPLWGFPSFENDRSEGWSVVERLMPGKCCQVLRVCAYGEKVWIEVCAGFAGPDRRVDDTCWLADDKCLQIIVDTWYETREESMTIQEWTLYKAQQNATVFDAPSRTSIIAGQVLRYQCARVRSQPLTYDPKSNELWARLDDPRDKWICVSECVNTATEKIDTEEPTQQHGSSILLFEALPQLRGEAHFVNVYSRHYAVGELPLRERPSLRAKKNATLPAYVVVRALSLKLIASGDLFASASAAESRHDDQNFSPAVGTLWIEIAAPESVTGSACWCVQANAKSGLVVLEPLSSEIVKRHHAPHKALFRNICSTRPLPMISRDDFLEAATAPCDYPSTQQESLVSAGSLFMGNKNTQQALTMLSSIKAQAQLKLEAAGKAQTVIAAKQRFQATFDATVAAAKRGVASRRRSFSPPGGHYSEAIEAMNEHKEESSLIENPLKRQPPKVPLGTCIRSRQVVLTPNGQLWAECEAPHSGEGFWAHALVDGAWTLKKIRNDDQVVAVYRVLEDVVLRTQPRGEDTGKVLHPGAAFLGGRRQLDDRGELWIQLYASDYKWIAESAGGKHDSVQAIFEGITVSELSETEVKALYDNTSARYQPVEEEAPSLPTSPPESEKSSSTSTLLDLGPKKTSSSQPSEISQASCTQQQELSLAALDEFAEASERAEKAEEAIDRDSALRACVTAAGLEEGYGLVANPPPPPVLKLVYQQEATCCFRRRYSEFFQEHAVLVFKVSSRDDRAVTAALHVLETGHTLEAPLLRQETKTRIRGVLLPKSCIFALEPNDLPEHFLLDPQNASITLHAVVLLDALAAGRRTASKPTVLRHRPSPQSRFMRLFSCLTPCAFLLPRIAPTLQYGLSSSSTTNRHGLSGGLGGGDSGRKVRRNHKYSRLDLNDDAADDDLEVDDPAYFSEGDPSTIPRNLPTNQDLPRPGEF